MIWNVQESQNSSLKYKILPRTPSLLGYPRCLPTLGHWGLCNCFVSFFMYGSHWLLCSKVWYTIYCAGTHFQVYAPLLHVGHALLFCEENILYLRCNICAVLGISSLYYLVYSIKHEEAKFRYSQPHQCLLTVPQFPFATAAEGTQHRAVTSPQLKSGRTSFIPITEGQCLHTDLEAEGKHCTHTPHWLQV